MRKSKANNYVVSAYDRGYRVCNGKVISPFSNKERALDLIHSATFPYYRFSVSYKIDGKWVRRGVPVHKLVAYQKFGKDAFEEGLVVRHLDGNSLNNRGENIDIGTVVDNAQDKLPEVRMNSSIKAATKKRKFTDEEMDKIRKFHINSTYKNTMKQFNITSKGTLWYILNNDYKTKV